MTVNRTTLLDLPLPVTGTESGTWGDVTNNGLSQYVDIAVAGMTSLTSSDFTAGALTIANTQGDSGSTNIAAASAQYATIKTSSLAANSTITAPASNRSYRIINADSTYTLTIKASGQTGVTFLPGTTGVVAFNGTDYEIVGVVGAASATDNAIPKFDGTTGQIIQNTGVTIDDSNNVSGVAQLNATTADLTNLEVTNIKAKDGTAAGSIANSTGVVTLASSILTTTDINGGTIDGATIGGASAAAGSFTTLNTSGQVVFNDAGANVDFRVEGDTNANVLFVDASADAVGIRTNSLVASDVKFEVRDGIVAITDSTGGDCRLFMGGSTSPNHSKGQIRYSNADESLEFYANSAERMRITSTGFLQYANGAQAGTKRNDSFSVPGSGSATAFDLWSGNEGRGLYLVSATRESGNVGTRVVAIVGSAASSLSIIYDVLTTSQLSLTVSGSSIVVNNSSATAQCSAVAIPLTIDGV